MKAFLTGSRRYGQPTENSDLDLVVLLTKDELVTMAGACIDNLQVLTEAEYGNLPDHCVFRFGPLNLIVCTTQEDYDIWVEATANCVTKSIILNRGLTRDEAVSIFDTVRDLRNGWE